MGPTWGPAVVGAVIGAAYAALNRLGMKRIWRAPHAPLNVVVTGGTRGLGKAMAREFLRSVSIPAACKTVFVGEQHPCLKLCFALTPRCVEFLTSHVSGLWPCLVSRNTHAINACMQVWGQGVHQLALHGRRAQSHDPAQGRGKSSKQSATAWASPIACMRMSMLSGAMIAGATASCQQRAVQGGPVANF